MAEDDERLRQAIRVGTIGIFDHDHQTDVIFWSLEMRQIYGWDPDEPVTIPKIVSQVHPEDRGRTIEAIQRAHDPGGDGAFDIELYVKVPVTTLCPCSREISAYGAHNQRGWVTARVRTCDHVWLEELIEMIEESASCALFPVLKRPDEKWVTEHAYDNPRFVEDMVREVAVKFDADTRIVSYEVEVENEESIHAHNAYACLQRSKS